jgi:DNA polymerase III epsilon subunit-like protein
MKRAPFDCETGGLTTDKSLLTFYMAIVDENLNVIDELDLKLKPDDGVYNCDAEALKINGIDLAKHDADPETITYTEGSKRLKSFAEKHHTGGRWPTLIPAGHNIPFDIGFTQAYLMPEAVWRKFFSHRLLDTAPICNFKKDAGKWPEKLGTLTSMVEFMGVPKRNAHNAKDDTLMWIDCYREILRQEKASGSGSVATDDLIITEL